MAENDNPGGISVAGIKPTAERVTATNTTAVNGLLFANPVRISSTVVGHSERALFYNPPAVAQRFTNHNQKLQNSGLKHSIAGNDLLTNSKPSRPFSIWPCGASSLSAPSG
ncbi:MAG: hypothetical protein JO138_17135 [Acidobacteriaceae bacterium]|nr:hypothetical protein [Acidobacteriaceae bacterium]